VRKREFVKHRMNSAILARMSMNRYLYTHTERERQTDRQAIRQRKKEKRRH
jgi:hypothetical protein